MPVSIYMGLAAVGLGVFVARGLGAMFFIMGAIPLLLWGRHPGNISAALAGTSHIDGTSVGSVSSAYGRPKETAPAFPLDPIDYAVLIPLWLLAGGFGVWFGMLWFQA